MKHLLSLLAMLSYLAVFAAVPLVWTVETSRVSPVSFDAYHGETLALEAYFKSYGTPLQMPVNGCCILWQTNGMGSAWWQAPATVVSNRVSAAFTPSMDPGAATVVGFLGATGQNYRAAFTLRFRRSPGATPNVIDAPLPILDLANTVVVNPPWPTRSDFAATTTVMRAELKDYVDGEIESAGLITPQSVTNMAASVITNHVASNYLCTKQMVEDISNDVYLDAVSHACAEVPVIVNTQYIKQLGFLGGFSDYAYGANTYRKNVGYIYLDGSKVRVSDGNTPTLRETSLGNILSASYTTINNQQLNGSNITISPSTIGAVPTSRKVNGKPLTSDITIESMPSNGLVLTNDAVKTKSGTSITASQVGAADASTVNQIGASVSAIAAHLNAEDARFVSTNYDSVVRTPEAYVEIKINNNWQTIWREMTRWGKFVGNAFDWNAWSGFHTWSTNVTAQLALKADRCWGVYDSETGEYSPDGFTQISSSNLVIASNMSYKRVIGTGGVWVLQANAGLATFGGDTNGCFRVMDGDGTTQLEIIKGDLRELGCDAGGISIASSGSTRVLTIPYSVVAAEHPTIKVCTDLSEADWIAEGVAGCAATVAWSGSSGAYVATVTTVGNSSLFVKATYMGGSETVIHNIAPTKMDSIIIGNAKYTLGTATISGHTVLTLTPAN